MYKSQGLGIGIICQCLLSLVDIDSGTPFVFNHDGLSPTAFNVFLHAATKYTILADNDLVAWLQQIHKDSFHAGRTRCRNRESKLVLGLKGELQKAFNLVHHSDECRVQMADGGP